MRQPRTNRSEIRTSISQNLKKVMFSQTAVTICEEEGTAIMERFLLRVLESEIASREESRRSRLLREASFPVYKTLSTYENGSCTFPPTLTRDELETCSFVGEKKNLVLYGPVGTGKTHLAIALGVRSCELGFRVKFYTAAQLVVLLSEALGTGTLEKLMRSILKAELLIIDEWGYVPVSREGAQLLFRVISESYEQRSLILTTNLEFSKWGTIMTDDQMAAAMIDRLAHHGYVLIFEGESYRMKHALMRQKNRSKIPTA